MKTEIASLLIVTKLEQFDYAGAAAIALLMLVSSFVLLFLVNVGQWWSTRHSRRREPAHDRLRAPAYSSLRGCGTR